MNGTGANKRAAREQMIETMARAMFFNDRSSYARSWIVYKDRYTSLATTALDSINQWAVVNPETVDEIQAQRELEPTVSSWQCYCKDHPTCTGPYCHICGASEPSSYNTHADTFKPGDRVIYGGSYIPCIGKCATVVGISYQGNSTYIQVEFRDRKDNAMFDSVSFSTLPETLEHAH